MSLGTASMHVRDFFSIMLKTRESLHVEEERHVALASLKRLIHIFSSHLSSFISYTLFLHLSYQILDLLQGNCSLASQGNSLYCSARDPNVLVWGCCVGYKGDVPVSHLNPTTPHRFLSTSPPPGIPSYGGYNCCCKFCRCPTPLS